MGREIVYCQGCGKRLTEDDFDRGKAQTHDHRPFCSSCRPVTAPPPTRKTERSTERRTATSTTRRRTPTERIPRVPAPAAPAAGDRKPGHMGWFAGGALAAIVIILIVVAASSGKETRPAAEASAPVKAPSAADRIEDRLRELESFAAKVVDPESVLVRCDQLRPDFRGSPLEPRFKQVEFRALERLKEKERLAELEVILKVVLDDPACVRRVEVEGRLEAALKKAGGKNPEVEKVQADYRSRCEAVARKKEAEKVPPRIWTDCFILAGNRITANDYPGAKPLYLEGLATLPAARPDDLAQRAVYCVGLYNLACIYSVEASKRTDAARTEAVDNAFKYLDWALRSDYGHFRCPCHPQTLGLGHMADDKDMDAIRGDARYAELVKRSK